MQLHGHWPRYQRFKLVSHTSSQVSFRSPSPTVGGLLPAWPVMSRVAALMQAFCGNNGTKVVSLLTIVFFVLLGTQTWGQITTDTTAGPPALAGDTSKPGKYKPSTRPTGSITDRRGDPFSNPSTGSPLLMDKPGNLKTQVELDSNDNSYTIYEKLGDLDYRPTSTMSFKEYTEYRQRQAMRSYMKGKAEGEGGNGQLGNNRLIPKVYLNPTLANIFGGNTIDIRPNGSIMLDFGFLHQQVNNPVLPIQQQTQFQFLFDQQISLNVQGKVGEKLKLAINYDTKANFEFENNVKLEYNSLDHEILQKVEAGNVSLPLSNSLITGAQNLFGLKTTMRFGRTKVVAVGSVQRGKQNKLVLRGGSQTRDLMIRADAYEANRHFFLSSFFRANYEPALRNPAIVPPPSGVRITRVEAYITNRANNTSTIRAIAGITDLGDAVPFNAASTTVNGPRLESRPTNNANNDLFGRMTRDRQVRNVDETNDRLTNGFGLRRSEDFEVLRGARKLLDRDFTFHPQLGYLSLNSPLRDDEVLAVAYEYAFNGQVYRVGELTDDYQALQPNDVVLLKLLRPSKNNYANNPMWRLQMRNIYGLGSSGINREGFQLRIIYRDDSTGVDNPSLRQGANLVGKQLVEVFNLDRLNPANELQPDGNFDFIEGVTIDSRNGRIIFPVLEPFGANLAALFNPNERAYRNKYVFDELYTQVQAVAQQAANKNKFFFVGRTQSAAGGFEVQLPSPNIAPGSVVVQAGTAVLQENSDYNVDYQLGKVRIVNTGVMSSGQDIEIRYETADLFNFQQRSFFGTRVDHTISKDINIGGTALFLDERPLIRRTTVGEEPTTNLMWGLDVQYKKDSRFLTKMLDLLPFYETKEVSNINFTGEYARIHPLANTFVDPSGRGISYIDDFEGSRITTDLYRQPVLWRLATTPPEKRGTNVAAGPLTYNDFRARMAWYNIDQVFYRSVGGVKPPNITDDYVNNNDFVRPIGPQEVYQNRDLQAVNLNEFTMDLAYYPFERGQYNFSLDLNPDGTLRNPRQNWGGMMRGLTTNNDFDAANIEFVEFWVMSPFKNDPISGAIETRMPDGTYRTFNDNNRRRGLMHIDIGAISEDVMPDNKYQFEQGLPTPGQSAQVASTTEWGRVPNGQRLTPAFANDGRDAQDVGLDGLNDTDEADIFRVGGTPYVLNAGAVVTDPNALATINEDPAADNFQYYLQGPANNKILDRYKYYNNTQGNSPNSAGGTFTPSSYTTPDEEDLNNDQTLNQLDQYYSYKVRIDPSELVVGRNYVVDKLVTNEGRTEWYLMRIPLRDLNHPNGVKAVGGIDNFNNMRFIRVWMDGFEDPVVLRLLQFQLVASTWRPYTKQLTPRRPVNDDEPDGALTVASVNVEENGALNPSPGKVPYVIPPNISRDRDVTSGVNRRLNEQSLSICVDRLRDNDAKAAFKNVKFDFLNYQRLQMFIHAHTQNEGTTRDGDLAAFIRLGTDFDENYYEVEIPLKLTPTGQNLPADQVWPSENQLDIRFDDLYGAKVARNFARIPLNMAYAVYNVRGTTQNVYVVGNPDMNACNTIMLGVRNTRSNRAGPKNVCIWFNELRVTDFIKNEGWGTTGRLAVKLADLGQVTASGKFTSIGFGSIDQRISERSRFDNYSYNLSTNLALDKFLPKWTGIKLPMYYSIEQIAADPQYDPLNPDIKLESTLEGLRSDPNTASRADQYRDMVRDLTSRRSINFTNVQRVKTGKNSRSFPWDIENFNFTYAYSEQLRSNINVASNSQTLTKYAIGYNYSTGAGPIEPFKNMKFLDKSYLKWLKEFNFSLLPSLISFRADLDRQFNRLELRGSDVFGPNLNPTFEKLFTFNRTYGLRWSPFKSLSLDYSANSQAIIDEPPGENNQLAQDSVWKNIRRGGRTKVFNQTVRANYKLPLDKLPGLDFVTADVTYSAGLNWSAAPTALQDTLGNTLQNNRERSLNGQINLLKLYNKVKWLNDINTPAPAKPQPKTPVPPAKGKDGADAAKKDTAKKPREWRLLKGLARVMMSARNFNLSYTVTENTALPGFIPTPDFAGMNVGLQAPGIPFLLGDQDPEIRRTAAESGWLGRSRLQNQPFTQVMTENLTGRLSLEPVQDMRMQLDWKMSNSANYSEIWRDSNQVKTLRPNFQSFNAARGGNYSISYMAINTAFLGGNDADNKNEAFRRMEQYRGVVYNRLMQNYELNRERILATTTDTALLTRPGEARYDSNSQDVLIPAFIAAYTGQDPLKVGLSAFPRIPLPNWRLDYAGLTKIPSLAAIFSSINLTHSYTSSYQVASYSSNLAYGPETFGLDRSLYDYETPTRTTTSNGQRILFQSPYTINSVVITERFAPLVGINVRTKSKITLRADYNRDRNMALNLSNAQVTEVSSQDITIGGGFAASGVKLPIRIQGRQVVLSNELQTRMDVTFRETETVQRLLDRPNTITMGNQDLQLKPSINYVINQRMNVQAYYEYTLSNPKISNSFRRVQQRFGVQFRFTLM